MVTQLKALLGKPLRMVVVNGKLVMVSRKPLCVQLKKYRVVFTLLGSESEVQEEDAIKLIDKYITDFGIKYNKVLGGAVLDPDAYELSVDPFTNAVHFTTEAFRVLSDEKNHAPEMQFRPEVKEMLKSFIIEYTAGYMDLYYFLINKRLSAQHMPMLVKSHLVSGFFQPLVVDTDYVKSPLIYGENTWLRECFAGYEERLPMQSSNSTKLLELSCVAMCDIAEILKCKVVTELDRRAWMFAILCTLLGVLDKNASSEFSKRYGRYFEYLTATQDRGTLFASLVELTLRRKALVVR